MRIILLFALLCASALHAAEWLTDYDEALAQARQEHKPVLVDFTGSDWCIWCIKLRQEVFSQPEFLDWAHGNVILLELDFPRNIPQSSATKQMNASLAQKFNVDGFPTILILNPDGSEKARTGYRRGGAESYVEHLQTLIK